MERNEVRERLGEILLNVNNICGHKIYGLHFAFDILHNNIRLNPLAFEINFKQLYLIFKMNMNNDTF